MRLESEILLMIGYFGQQFIGLEVQGILSEYHHTGEVNREGKRFTLPAGIQFLELAKEGGYYQLHEPTKMIFTIHNGAWGAYVLLDEGWEKLQGQPFSDFRQLEKECTRLKKTLESLRNGRRIGQNNLDHAYQVFSSISEASVKHGLPRIRGCC